MERNVFHESSRIDSTWGGNLVDMMRSRRVLEIIEEDNLLENAADVGAYLLVSFSFLHLRLRSVLSGQTSRAPGEARRPSEQRPWPRTHVRL